MTADEEFRHAVSRIRILLAKYPAEDVAVAIFTSEIWLGNIAGLVRHLFFSVVFVSMQHTDFSAERSLKTYHDFREFLKELYALSPDFPSVEDFVPEIDWGGIRFPIEKKQYRILYGGDVSNVYDLLTQFRFVYEPLNKRLQELIGASPMGDLEECVALQDFLISGISSQPAPTSLSLNPGEVSIPPEGFWKDAAELVSRVNREFGKNDFSKRYSVNLGALPDDALTHERFGNFIFKSGETPFFFAVIGNVFFPLLVRRSSGVIIDCWGKHLKSNFEIISEEDKRLGSPVSGPLYKFMKHRFRKETVFPLVSAKGRDGGPSKLVFPLAITSKKRLILLYIVPPTDNEELLADELVRVVPDIEESVKRLGESPTQLFWHFERKRIEFHAKDADREPMVPSVLIVVPQVTTDYLTVRSKTQLPGRVAFLSSLVAVLDEVEDSDELSDFLDFLEEQEAAARGVLTSLLDMFAAFRDSHRVLVGGADRPDFIMLDPHWGESFRYRSLATFWNLFPRRNYNGDPRSWSIDQEGITQLRLSARAYFGSAIYTHIGETHVFLSAPFADLAYDPGRTANFLMECAQDGLSKSREQLKQLRIFSEVDEMNVLFFPHSAVTENPEYKHLRHLDPKAEAWTADAGFFEPKVLGIRIVFNEDKVTDAFSKADDRKTEIALHRFIIEQINALQPDRKMKSIMAEIEKGHTEKPRFKLFSIKKPASFPMGFRPWQPNPPHFKRAKKRIAEIAMKIGIAEGLYSSDNAKAKLNLLKKAIVEEINGLVLPYSFAKSAPKLLARADAQMHKREMGRIRFRKSFEHEVEYDRVLRYTEEKSDALKLHQNYRYLIEKFVQLAPAGDATILEDSACYLLALIDWLIVIQSASDALHYGITPAGMRVGRDFQIDVEYDEKEQKQQDEFGKEQAHVDAETHDDAVKNPRGVKETMEAMDSAFVKDFGFRFTALIHVLFLLAHWAERDASIAEAPSYSATEKEILIAAEKSVKDFDVKEGPAILDFLTLKAFDVIRILKNEKAQDDIPLWEHKKRYARYTIRPLIRIDEQFVWAPYAVRQAGLLWSGLASKGSLPADVGKEAVHEFLEQQKHLMDDAVEDQALQIVKRFTKFAAGNVQLHKLDKAAAHPDGLGDYDVLAYCPEKHIILNIECKNLLPAYCLKDAKTLRQTIFGVPGKDAGHFEQIDKRQGYLRMNWQHIAPLLKWPLRDTSVPKILSLYVTPMMYWWTRFPPREVDTTFVRLSALAEFCQSL